MGLAFSLGVLQAAPQGDAAARAVAKRHFEAAETHYRLAEFDRALAEYKKALAAYRHPAFLFNIAQCYRHLKNYEKALFFYRLFLSELPQAGNRQEVLGFIRQMEKQLQAQRVAARRRGSLSILTRPAGARVFVDSLEDPARGVTPVILRDLPAGDHLIVIRLPGYRDVTRKVTIGSGSLLAMEVDLVPLAAPRRAEPRRAEPRRAEPRPRPRARRRAVPPKGGSARPVPPPLRVVRTAPFHKRWWFWTGLSVAAVALVGTTVAGLRALDYRDQYNDPSQPLDDPENTRNKAKTYALFSDVCTGVAVVVGGATILGAILVGRGRVVEQPVRGATLLPACGPTGCALTVSGSF